MDSFQLDCFLSVATHLNFAHAADEMNITQPAISRRIRSLEEELNVKLFNRTTRSVSLTHEGEIFLSEASQFAIMFKAIKNKFSAPERRGMLPIRIACTSEMLMNLLPDVLYRLAEEEPDVHPILSNIITPQIVQKITDGNADMVLGLKENLLRSGEVVYTELTRSPLVCACDGTYPISDEEETSISELKNYFLIFYRPSFCDSEIAALQAKLAEGRQSNEIFFCDDITSALTLMLGGFGITVIPKIFLPKNIPDIRTVPITDKEPLSFGIYHKKNCSPLQKKFISILSEQIKNT